ncbi:MAG: hypothetical protein U0704_12060 [Candidatus Eisenbacteria bacterium]
MRGRHQRQQPSRELVELGRLGGLAAPGEGVWSSIARNYAYDDLTWWYFETYCGFDGAHAYLANDGTSFSSPIVAGAARSCAACTRTSRPAWWRSSWW